MDDLLLETAINFKNMFNKKYDFILGRKGNQINLTLIFRPVDFHHLAGLQYISDMSELKRSRDMVFSSIYHDERFRRKIYESSFYPQIKDRLSVLKNIEMILDSDKMIFRYDLKANSMSNIKADYLISAHEPYNNNRAVYIFCDHIKESNTQIFSKSIFPKTKYDYTQFQCKYTILKITKTQIDTNEIIYSKVNPKYIESTT